MDCLKYWLFRMIAAECRGNGCTICPKEDVVQTPAARSSPRSSSRSSYRTPSRSSDASKSVQWPKYPQDTSPQTLNSFLNSEECLQESSSSKKDYWNTSEDYWNTSLKSKNRVNDSECSKSNYWSSNRAGSMTRWCSDDSRESCNSSNNSWGTTTSTSTANPNDEFYISAFDTSLF